MVRRSPASYRKKRTNYDGGCFNSAWSAPLWQNEEHDLVWDDGVPEVILSLGTCCVHCGAIPLWPQLRKCTHLRQYVDSSWPPKILLHEESKNQLSVSTCYFKTFHISNSVYEFVIYFRKHNNSLINKHTIFYSLEDRNMKFSPMTNKSYC